jgi:hypothetical protein
MHERGTGGQLALPVDTESRLAFLRKVRTPIAATEQQVVRRPLRKRRPVSCPADAASLRDFVVRYFTGQAGAHASSAIAGIEQQAARLTQPRYETLSCDI